MTNNNEETLHTLQTFKTQPSPSDAVICLTQDNKFCKVPLQGIQSAYYKPHRQGRAKVSMYIDDLEMFAEKQEASRLIETVLQ